MCGDVNAIVGNRHGDWLAAKLLTWWQRSRRDNLADRVILERLAKAGVATGWSIGPIILGRYYAP